MTTVRLAAVSGRMGAALSVADLSERARPALLVSYAYCRQTFDPDRRKYPLLDQRFRDYALDSGAFTADNAGRPVDLGAYITFCRDRLRTDKKLTEIFALDVIGDWEATARNTAAMWAAGLRVIPTFHVGEPDEALQEMARLYPKIAVGGVVRWSWRRKLAWVEQVFARVWPKRIHGLGIVSEQITGRVPFHSVDASDWEFTPCGFGNWRSMPGIRGPRISKRKAVTLRAEVEWYLRLERRLQQRWGPTLATLERSAA